MLSGPVAAWRGAIGLRREIARQTLSGRAARSRARHQPAARALGRFGHIGDVALCAPRRGRGLRVGCRGGTLRRGGSEVAAPAAVGRCRCRRPERRRSLRLRRRHGRRFRCGVSGRFAGCRPGGLPLCRRGPFTPDTPGRLMVIRSTAATRSSRLACAVRHSRILKESARRPAVGATDPSNRPPRLATRWAALARSNHCQA